MITHLSTADVKHHARLSVERSGIDVEQFRHKTILVTGGTGFFGCWLLPALAYLKSKLDGELNVIALSRNPTLFLSTYPELNLMGCIEFIKGDVTNFSLEGHRATHLLHMATTSAMETFGGHPQAAKLSTLAAGTQHVIDTCGDHLESVLFTSSGVVYGSGHQTPMSETSPIFIDTSRPDSALAAGKLFAETLVASRAAELGYHFGIARCFAFAGPYLPLDLHYAFGNFIFSTMRGQACEITGTGDAVRSYMHVGDATAWLLRLLSEPKDALFNIGSEVPISIHDLASLISDHGSCEPPIFSHKKADGTGVTSRSYYVPSTKKMRLFYKGLDQWTSLTETINQMLHSHAASVDT